LARAARREALPLAALGKAMFGNADEYETARVLAAARCGATWDSVPDEELPHTGAALRSGRELARRLADFPDAVRNNRRIAEQCAAFRLLPREAVFPAFDPPDGWDAQAYLRHLCREGIRRRYGRASAEVRQRLEKELGLIERRGFSGYFLVVWDIVQYARRQHVPVAGRGSGASSLVAYLLGITNVCPLAFEIPFERFLNDRRADFPDLDIDFCWRIRDDVIDYTFRRWGDACTAMVCTHNTFQERSAFRETAKAFGLSDDQISRLTPADVDRDERLERIGRLSRRIIGLLHNLSVHPGGIVIAPRGIDRHVPIQPAPKGVMITQFDKNGVKGAGLVKLDLLGNRSLSTIRYACNLIARHEGKVLDVESLPPADAATIRTLQAADTVGCNQIESPAMRHLLRGLQPRSARALMKTLALIRPGAASIGMKETFVRRHRGLEQAPPDLPAVAKVLGNTHGVMLYEDDVMLVAAAMLGSDLAEADRFRKAVQKCRSDTQRLALSREFLARCQANGVDVAYAKRMWVQMAKFNSYSFCRAHAASYAMLAYASAYLKTHYPLEFWVACLNNNQSMYHPRVYVEQAKRKGVRFLLPDVNRSGVEFAIDTDGAGARAVRIALNRIRGLGPASVEAILAARRDRPFDGLTDCLARTRLGREEV
jgi:DNA-directed DNA polymerase III PolC